MHLPALRVGQPNQTPDQRTNERKLPGYLSPSAGLKFADVPNGLAAISKVPAAGWGQILAYMAFCEVSQDQSAGTPAAAGDFGFKVLTASDPEAKKTKRLHDHASPRRSRADLDRCQMITDGSERALLVVAGTPAGSAMLEASGVGLGVFLALLCGVFLGFLAFLFFCVLCQRSTHG